MKKLLASTALLLTIAAPGFAQDATGFMNAPATGDIYASNLMGMDLYVTDKDVSNDTVVTSDQLSNDWNDVGSVGDVLISQAGEVKAVILDIGGFLGMGEHTIAVDMSQLHFLHEQDNPSDIFIAMKGTKDSLEAAPEFKRDDMIDQAAMTPAPATDANGVAAPSPAPAAADSMAATRWDRPAMQMDGYADVPADQVTANTLTGATVYGPDDKSVGEVSDLVVNADGKVTDAIVDVGGFLGIGEHSVEVAFDEMQIMQNADGSDVRVNISATKDQLEGRPEYKQS